MKRNFLYQPFFPILTCLLFLAGMNPALAGTSRIAMPRYFSSPEESVTITSELLKAEDWKKLAGYYDLSNTDIEAGDLVSGKFFLRTERPEVGHPGLPWKYREPFTPGFLFHHVEEGKKPDLIEVMVGIEIDEGGGMKQRGMMSFPLKKSRKGYQLVPKAGVVHLSWKDFDGTGDAGKARYLLDAEELGIGDEGIKTLRARISGMYFGTSILIVPYYGDSGGAKKYPFNTQVMMEFSQKHGIRFLLPQGK